MPGLLQDETTGVQIIDHHDSVVLDTADVESRLIAAEAGGAANALRVAGPYVFSYDDAGIEDGIEFFTPAVGDVVLHTLFVVITPFDGTTPTGGMGTFTSGGYGIHYFDPTTPWTEAEGAGMLSDPTLPADNPFVSVNTNPFKLYVSQDDVGSASVGGTEGEVHVYLIIGSSAVE
jgi:hypothetical protein